MRRFGALIVMAVLASALCLGPVNGGELVTLRDASGRSLKPAQMDELSMFQTCGECHDVPRKAASVHFNRSAPSDDPESADCLACHAYKPAFSADGSLSTLSARPPDAACLGCHSEVRSKSAGHSPDAHSGLACVDCHRGAGHSVSQRASCAGCHSRKANAPAHRGFTKLHLRRISCQRCHSASSHMTQPAGHVASGGRRISGVGASHSVLPSSQALGSAGCVQCHSRRQGTRAGWMREGVVKPLAPWASGVLLALCALHYLIFRPVREKHVRGEPTVERFTLLERLIHASAAGSFAFLAVTGTAFLLRLETPGGPWREIHGQVGGVFALSICGIFALWRRQARFEGVDALWLRRLGGYLWIKGPCPAGKFNAGQKMFFWVIAVGAGTMVSGTGIFMALASDAPGWVFTAHDLAAIVLLLGIAGHVYLSLFANPGSLRAIVTGRVAVAWARRHHSDWLVTRSPACEAGQHSDGTFL